MSSRAIRRLREERETTELPEVTEDSEEEEEEPLVGRKNAPAFLAMMDDSDDESDQDEESEKDEKEEESVDQSTGEKPVEKEKEQKVVETEQSEEPEEEEDLDALLAEFESHDQQAKKSASVSETSKPSSCWFDVLVAGTDVRDFDIDHVMRTSLMGSADQDASPPPMRMQRRSRQNFLFGPPRDDWVRPPHYVGGGLGMVSYDDEEKSSSSPRSLPWPYNEEGLVRQQLLDPKLWFTFVRSDTYAKDCQDYDRIQQTGNVNSLAMFVAHHPYVTEALLQLCMVLYQTNQNQQGLALLRRCLWVYECASLSSFAQLEKDGCCCFMDHDLIENASYFNALFRLMQVSGMAGYIRTSLAVSRFLLSLDPLRDPMGVLLLLDYFALATRVKAHDRFVVDLVESGRIEIHYRETLSEKHHQCSLVDLPNWAFSYALALYRVDEVDRANEALQTALHKFPSVVELILEKNEVNVTGRSFQTDWPPVLDKLRQLAFKAVNAPPRTLVDKSIQSSADAACDLITRIFVQRNYTLWRNDDVLLWLYQNCANYVSLLDNNNDNEGDRIVYKASPALIRYRQCDPSDYEDRFRHLPEEANPLDPAFLGPALAIDPNRRRFLRQQHPRQGGDADWEQDAWGAAAQQQQGLLLGGGPPQLIDPDSPLMEVFWRSMLPWNHVDGVPPPRR